MFIVWIITNLRNKERKGREKVRANKILAKVDESFEHFFYPRNFKIKSFYCFLYLRLVAVASSLLSSASAAYAGPLQLFQDDGKHF